MQAPLPWQCCSQPGHEGDDKLRHHIKNQRPYFANKGPSSQSYGFSRSHVWMWELEHQRIHAFELWCWWRLLRVLWTARSNQSILKEINSEYSWEGLMLKPKLQNTGHLMQRTESPGKTLMLGKIEGRRRSGQQKMRWLYDFTDSQWTWIWENSRRYWRTGKPGMLQSMGLQRIGDDLATEQQQT